MSKYKKFYKYKRLNCGPTSKQCGMGCIPRDHKCDGKEKSKISLLKNNVKKDVSRLENGGDFGKVSEKAFAKVLVTDKEIGQKMPGEMAPIVANSDKLDDRVKKAYVDSATRSSWNWKGKFTSVKLKKPDPAFQRKIYNRKLTHRVDDVSQEKERDEKKERKKFFATTDGQQVLKTLASVALVGGIAATAAYTISTAKTKKDENETKPQAFGLESGTSPALEQSRASWKDEHKTRTIESTAEAISRTGDDKSARIIAKDKFYDNPNTVYESYTDVYQRAHRLQKLNKAGNLSPRNKDDYMSMWGFSHNDANNHKVDGQIMPKPESTLGLARKRVIDDLNEQGYTTDADHKAVLAYHSNPKNFERIKKFGRKYNPEKKIYELPGHDADSDLFITPASEREGYYPKSDPSESYDKKVAIRNKEREQYLNPFGKDQEELQQTRPDDAEWISAKQGAERDDFRPTSGDPGLTQTQKQRQRKEWEKLTKEQRLQYNDVDLLRQVSPEDDYGSIFGNPGIHQDVEARLRYIYPDTQLEAMRENNIKLLDESILIGRAVLPEYKAIALESENAQGTASVFSRDEQKYEVGGIENIGEKSGGRKPSRQELQDLEVTDARTGRTKGLSKEEKSRLKRQTASIHHAQTAAEARSEGQFKKKNRNKTGGVDSPEVTRLWEQETSAIKQPTETQWEDTGPTKTTTSPSGKKLAKKKVQNADGSFTYYWNGTIFTAMNDNEAMEKIKDQWRTKTSGVGKIIRSFAEDSLEPYVYQIIEENNGIIICETDEGLIAYDFSNDENYRTIYL